MNAHGIASVQGSIEVQRPADFTDFAGQIIAQNNERKVVENLHQYCEHCVQNCIGKDQNMLNVNNVRDRTRNSLFHSLNNMTSFNGKQPIQVFSSVRRSNNRKMFASLHPDNQASHYQPKRSQFSQTQQINNYYHKRQQAQNLSNGYNPVLDLDK